MIVWSHPRKIVGTEVNGSWLHDWMLWGMLCNELWQGYCMTVLPAYMQPNTHRKQYRYMSTPVQQYCYSVPWYSRHILCSCAYVTCAAASDLCDFVTDTAVTLMWLSHTPSISHSCVSCMCVYVFVCVQPAVVGIEGMRECVVQCFYRSINSVCFARVFIVTVIREELIGFRGN